MFIQSTSFDDLTIVVRLRWHLEDRHCCFPVYLIKALEVCPSFTSLLNALIPQKGGFLGTKGAMLIEEKVNAKVFEYILRYVHNLEIQVEPSYLWRLRDTAARFHIEELVNDIDLSVIASLTKENFCPTLVAYLNNPSMTKRCIDHLKHLTGDHRVVLLSPFFLKLKMFPHLQLLLQSSDLKVYDEEFLMITCERWLNHQPEQHRRFLEIKIYTALDARASSMLGKAVPRVLHSIDEESEGKSSDATVDPEIAPSSTAPKDTAWTIKRKQQNSNSPTSIAGGCLIKRTDDKDVAPAW